MAGNDHQNKSFESALEELETMVEQLECGELPLEESLAVFEKGVGLVHYCNQRLVEVERKIELLIKDKEGRLQFRELASESEDV